MLLLRRFNTGYEDGNFSLIAGHLNGNEPLEHAMVREAQEEAGITIRPEELRLAHVLHRLTREADGLLDERIEFFFVVDQWQGELTIMEPDKCDALEWHSLCHLPGNTIGYITHVLDQVANNQIMSSYGWNEPDAR